MDGAAGRRLAYEEPFLWWGPVWTPPPALTMVDLLRRQVLSPAVAAVLWSGLVRRRSLVVIAGPRGVGKTTLLTALLDGLPPGTRRLYLRGCHETFAFLDDATIRPDQTVLLVNEISPHLPAYLWGPAVRRLLQSTRRGFSFAATAHAATVAELIGDLAGYPLRVPLSELAAISLVAILRPSAEPAGERWRVDEVWTTAFDRRRGLSVTPLALAGAVTDAALDQPPGGALLTAGELGRRTDYLAALTRSDQSLDAAAVRRCLAAFGG